MTGRPGYGTMEMIGGSSTSYLACTPCVLLFCNLFNRGGNRSAFRLPGAGGRSFPLYGGTFARSYSVSKFANGTCFTQIQDPRPPTESPAPSKLQRFESLRFLGAPTGGCSDQGLCVQSLNLVVFVVPRNTIIASGN